MAFLTVHPEAGHQPNEFWIGPVIKDNEARVDGIVSTLDLDVVSFGMSSEPSILFEQSDFVRFCEGMGGDETGDPATDNGNPLP